MSNPVHILVAPPSTASELAHFVSLFIGHPLERRDKDYDHVYVTRTMGFEILVYDDHDFEDGQGIEFSRYSTAIGFDGLVSVGYNPYYGECKQLLPKYMAAAIFQHLGHNCLVVDNLQVITATFERVPDTS